MRMFMKTARLRLLLAVSAATLIAAMPSLAADGAAPSTLSMLEAMVASGVITQEQANNILKDAAQRDAARAAKGETPQPLPDGTRRVTYVPEIVKQQLRDEIKGQVMEQAKAENWAAPNSHPEWTDRIRFSGDVRGRYEGIYYPRDNAAGAIDFTNFNSLNNQSTPINLKSSTLATSVPYYNVDQPRDRVRLRARLGVDADLGDSFTTNMRLATGDSNSPVSTNQTLGGSGGNFSKYSLWLDRASINYQVLSGRDGELGVKVGRFDNPFFSTDLVWDDDVGFDGVAVNGQYQLFKGVTPFMTAGVFPVYNTDLNFATGSATKTSSNDKWLYAIQTGTTWKARRDTDVKFGLAYYYFNNIEGRQADCQYDVTTCVSDLSRPLFAQKGNTYFALRNNINKVAPATDPEYQYFGLATPYHEAAFTTRTVYDGFAPIRIALDTEAVKNIAFNSRRISSRNPENNVGSSGNFEGGDLGYLMRLTVGSQSLKSRGDWNVNLAYKYLESDAVVDGFADSDFGMGGTNLKGFVIGGNLALSRNVLAGIRWMSADSIAGSPLGVDVFQADITARF